MEVEKKIEEKAKRKNGKRKKMRKGREKKVKEGTKRGRIGAGEGVETDKKKKTK